MSEKARPYHHGDLRRALLDAAWEEIARDGVRGLTLRAVARRVGVTHAAPYHHFADRDALLDQLALEAFEELDRRMSEAEACARCPLERLVALGRAYVDFACEMPERLEVMFRREASFSAESLAVRARPFEHLVEAMVSAQDRGLVPAEDPIELALDAWASVHGFSTIWTGSSDARAPAGGRDFAALRDGMLRRHAEGLRALAEAERRGSRPVASRRRSRRER